GRLRARRPRRHHRGRGHDVARRDGAARPRLQCRAQRSLQGRGDHPALGAAGAAPPCAADRGEEVVLHGRGQPPPQRRLRARAGRARCDARRACRPREEPPVKTTVLALALLALAGCTTTKTTSTATATPPAAAARPAAAAASLPYSEAVAARF